MLDDGVVEIENGHELMMFKCRKQMFLDSIRFDQKKPIVQESVMIDRLTRLVRGFRPFSIPFSFFQLNFGEDTKKKEHDQNWVWYTVVRSFSFRNCDQIELFGKIPVIVDNVQVNI